MLEFLGVVFAGICAGAIVFGAAVALMSLVGFALSPFLLVMLGWFCVMLAVVIALGVSS